MKRNTLNIREIKPPHRLDEALPLYNPFTDGTLQQKKTSVFFAGSIENGKAIDWQDKLKKELEKRGLDVDVFNPRRDDWDASWGKGKSKKKLVEQIEWELEHLENASVIAMYLQPGTISPISLLELGLFKSKKIIVCCPDGYFRQTNVDVTCKRYGIKMTKTWKSFVESLEFEIRRNFNL